MFHEDRPRHFQRVLGWFFLQISSEWHYEKESSKTQPKSVENKSITSYTIICPSILVELQVIGGNRIAEYMIL